MANSGSISGNEQNPLLVIVSGPSGVGKDAVLRDMKDRGSPFYMVTTVTTRPRRGGESEGVDYQFVSDAEFRDMREQDGLLEFAKVYGNWYGIPRSEVRQALQRGEDVIIKVDVQGAATLKRLLPEAVFIFLTPPSMGELGTRLRRRNTESSFDLELRMETAKEEMECLPLFDYMVVNHTDCLDLVTSQINAIITAEKRRVNPRRIRM